MSQHNCSQQEILEKIDSKLDEIIARLAKGDTAIALLDHRVSAVEKIVYGLCTTTLLAVVGGVLALVIK
jgi:hypothetical protein